MLSQKTIKPVENDSTTKHHVFSNKTEMPAYMGDPFPQLRDDYATSTYFHLPFELNLLASIFLSWKSRSDTYAFQEISLFPCQQQHNEICIQPKSTNPLKNSSILFIYFPSITFPHYSHTCQGPIRVSLWQLCATEQRK